MDLLALEPHERAAAGLFLGFQYPVEIPGVSYLQFLRESLNSQRRARGEAELSGAEFIKLAREQAALLGMDAEMLKRPVNVGFSGGEKKRAEMVQMGIMHPKFAILDETDSGLDIDALKAVGAGINRIMRAPDKGVLLITHYQRLLDYVGPDQVHVLRPAGSSARAGPSSPTSSSAKAMRRRRRDARLISPEGRDRAKRRGGGARPRPSPAALRAAPSPAGRRMTAPFPTRKQEDWRYADLEALKPVWEQFAEPLTLTVGPGETLEQVWLPTADDVQVRRVQLALGAGATARIFALNTAPVYGRIELEVRLAEGADFELFGANIGTGLSTNEFVTNVSHLGAGGRSRQTVRSVLNGKAVGSYLGKVEVARGAQQTDAEQSVKAMLLDRGATANCKPELEIFADDVKCAHGATVGELDAMQLFYAESRGLDPASARALLLEGFVMGLWDSASEPDAIRDAARDALRRCRMNATILPGTGRGTSGSWWRGRDARSGPSAIASPARHLPVPGRN